MGFCAIDSLVILILFTVLVCASTVGRQVEPGQNFTMRDAPSYEDMKPLHAEVRAGGLWSPDGCRARQKVAIVIPFRNRENHLRNLVNNLHGILRRQKLTYRIFVAQQVILISFLSYIVFSVEIAR